MPSAEPVLQDVGIPNGNSGPGRRMADLQRLMTSPPMLRVVRFLTVGCVGLSVDSTLFWLIYHSGVGAAGARAVSICLATVVTWQLNRRFTFSPSGRRAVHEGVRYALVAIVAQGFNYILFLTLLWATQARAPLLCLLFCAVVTASFSFAGQSRFSFTRVHRAPPASR